MLFLVSLLQRDYMHAIVSNDGIRFWWVRWLGVVFQQLGLDVECTNTHNKSLVQLYKLEAFCKVAEKQVMWMQRVEYYFNGICLQWISSALHRPAMSEENNDHTQKVSCEFALHE